MSVPTHLVGKRVGNNRIELVSLLGEGSYGAVYRGIIHRSGLRKTRLCAVKVLRTTNLDRHLLLCQRREIELHERVSDGDGVVTLYETFKEGNYQFIVMEFCPDGDLWDGINQGRYIGNDALIKDVFTQIIDATEHCHSHSVYHRDIKPENILVRNINGGHRTLLADFGLATGDQVSTEMRSGSPWYMSPECWDNWDESYATAPNDVWALGVLLMNLACGRHAPWKYAHQHDRFFKDFVKQPNLLRLFVPLSPQAHDILGRIFMPNPVMRITLHDLRIAIQSVTHFTVPTERLSEYHEYQRAVWKATVDASPLRPLCLKIIPISVQTTSAGEVHDGVTAPVGLASPELDCSRNVTIVDRLPQVFPITQVESCTSTRPELLHSSSSASSVDSDGPTTPEMHASIPDVEVPDITEFLHDNAHYRPQSTTKTGLDPSTRINSWQGILDAIRAL